MLQMWELSRFVEHAVTNSEFQMRGCIAASQLHSQATLFDDCMGFRDVVVFLSSQHDF